MGAKEPNQASAGKGIDDEHVGSGRRARRHWHLLAPRLNLAQRAGQG